MPLSSPKPPSLSTILPDRTKLIGVCAWRTRWVLAFPSDSTLVLIRRSPLRPTNAYEHNVRRNYTDDPAGTCIGVCHLGQTILQRSHGKTHLVFHWYYRRLHNRNCVCFTGWFRLLPCVATITIMKSTLVKNVFAVTTNLAPKTKRVITIRCTRSRGPRGLHCLVCSPRPGDR